MLVDLAKKVDQFRRTLEFLFLRGLINFQQKESPNRVFISYAQHQTKNDRLCPQTPHCPFSRETKFFEQLEEDFHLEVADARRGEEPLSTSNDLGMESASDGIAAERDVYLLLGARRGNRTEKDGYSPLEKWRRILHVERDTQILG